MKGFLTARDILLEELQKISKAINQDIDMNDFPYMLEDKESFSFCPSAADNLEISAQVPINMQNVSEVISFFCDCNLSCFLTSFPISPHYDYANFLLTEMVGRIQVSK